MKDDEQKIKPLPLLIGPANAEAVAGTSWRHVRERARAMGVRLLRAGRKCVVRADEYVAALERNEPVASSSAPVDPADLVRAQLGLRLKAGGS